MVDQKTIDNYAAFVEAGLKYGRYPLEDEE